jgi:hypothetical protein
MTKSHTPQGACAVSGKQFQLSETLQYVLVQDMISRDHPAWSAESQKYQWGHTINGISLTPFNTGATI